MNDETKAAVESLRREMADGDPDWWKRERLIFNHIDGEPARLAAAREEQREACAQRVLERPAFPTGSKYGSEVETRDDCAAICRSTPLDATPLADELETVRKERDDLALGLRGVKEGELVVVTMAEYDELHTLRARVEELEAFGAKVNTIRNSIVGAQALNWSEHIYPLVAALDAVGFEGLPYPEARANVGVLIERAEKAEAERDEAVEALRGLRNEVSAKLTGRDSEPGKFEAAWQTACTVLKKHPVKP